MTLKISAARVSPLYLLLLGLISSSVWASDPPLDVDWVFGQVRSKDLRSPGELLELLPADYRSSFTLVYQSHGLQGSSAEAPRVILFGADAKLVIAVGGDGSGLTADSVEISQFRDQTRSFEYREIQFPDPIGKTKSAVFSAANPIKCTACHGRDPRPNWHQYSEWQGAYGSADDQIYSSELSQFRKFLLGVVSSSVYSKLAFPPGSPVSPFREVETQPLPSDPLSMAFRPNARLGMLFSGLNALRVTGILEVSPLFAKYGSFLLSRLLGCPQSSDPVQGSKVLAALTADFPAVEPGRMARKFSSLAPVPVEFLENEGVEDFISELLIGAMGVDSESFNLDFIFNSKPKSLAYFDGVYNEAAILTDLLLRQNAARNSGVAPFISDITNYYLTGAPNFSPLLPNSHDPRESLGACPALWAQVQRFF